MVASLAFCIAVWSARTARANLMIAQGNSVARLLDFYASPSMNEALAALRMSELLIKQRLDGDHQDDRAFEEMVHRALQGRFAINAPTANPTSMMQVLRDSGRRIHWFVKQADILRRNGALSDDLFRQAVAETNGYRLWATVWLPYLKATPVEGQPEGHLAWADALVNEFPPVGGTD